MIEDGGEALRAHERETKKMHPRQSQGKLERLVPGPSRIAYSTAPKDNEMAISPVKTTSKKRNKRMSTRAESPATPAYTQMATSIP